MSAVGDGSVVAAADTQVVPARTVGTTLARVPNVETHSVFVLRKG